MRRITKTANETTQTKTLDNLYMTTNNDFIHFARKKQIDDIVLRISFKYILFDFMLLFSLNT